MEYLNTILSSVEIILKMIIVTLCGLLIGTIRKPDFKPADRKILMIIALCTCLIMAIGTNFNVLHDTESGLHSIVTAMVIIILAIVSGIPVIKKKGSNDSIAIAVSIWLTGTIGISIGLGLYFVGVVTTLFAYLIYGYPSLQTMMKDQNSDSG